MRIIAGSRRGHKLFDFDGTDIRPTTDRVRESMFNLIMPFIPDARVLDLFGGSGALSLEALSRGAESAVICDSDVHSVGLIKKNISALRFESETTVIPMTAQQFISEANGGFDIVFLDPPYNKGLIAPIITGLLENGILSQNGIIVLESDNTDEHGEFDGLEILKQRKYGRTFITVYRKL